MNKYLKDFLHRGLMFGGFGPIAAGIIFLILSLNIEAFALTGMQIFLAIISTYVLAFIQAGATVFNQIEHWPVAKSLLCHLATIYCAYVSCYLLNSWIPFEPLVIVIFTLIFMIIYFLIWSIVYFSIKSVSKRMNRML